MTYLDRTAARYAALTSVHADHVQYQGGGLLDPSRGYAWSPTASDRMPESTQRVLHELWAANLIEVETYRLFALRGHRVTTTTPGYLKLLEWADLEPQAA